MSMFKRIQLKRFIFELTFSEMAPTIVIQADFKVQGFLPAQMSEDDVREGHGYQQEILNGKWDWLVQKADMITLPVQNILVTLVDPVWDGSVRYGGGSIASNLKMSCGHCGSADCDWDCPDAQEWASDRDVDFYQDKNAELESNKSYNYACDGIESMILGHAIAGVIIDSPEYLEGVEAAIDAVANKV